MTDQARESVREGIASAQDEATRQANRGIDRTAEEVSRTSSALETAASEFEQGSIQHQLLHQAADGLTQISGSMRGKTLGQVASDLADFGRRNPATFLGGAALAGFAIARFARASRSPAGGGYGHYDSGARRYGAGTMPQPAATQTPTGAPGNPQTPVAGPASTGSTTGSAGGTSTSGTAGGAATNTTGSSLTNKGKPDV